jgi:hypothetical protein
MLFRVPHPRLLGQQRRERESDQYREWQSDRGTHEGGGSVWLRDRSQSLLLLRRTKPCNGESNHIKAGNQPVKIGRDQLISVTRIHPSF